MANEFQLHTKSMTNGDGDLVPSDANVSGTISNSAEVVVHAVYIANSSNTTDTIFSLGIYDGNNTFISSILHNVELPRSSTVSIEKPINLPQSSTATDRRKLKIVASGIQIYATASVLVIT